MRLELAFAFAAAVTAFASSALAQDQQREEEAAPAPLAAEAPVAPSEVGPRDHGVRLGIDVSYARSTGYDDPDGFAFGAPARIPIGFEVSGRTSRKVLLGVHFDAGPSSHGACRKCSALTVGIGGHLEVLFRETETFVPWLRYGIGLQSLVQTDVGARGGFDIADVRFGTDFVVSKSPTGKTTRIGPFFGVDLGILTGQSATVSNASSGTPYGFVAMGMRLTGDP